MNVKTHDPWTWQQGFGFSHGVEYETPRRLIEVSGQCATGPDGAPQGAGDMRRQIEVAIANIEAVLRQAGMGLQNVVRIRVFATDIGLVLANWDAVVGRLNAAGSRPASTLLGISSLFSPELMVEIEAMAAE
jgi:enamine deaminase RidA (YjgF/YER057c/UK114 family)